MQIHNRVELYERVKRGFSDLGYIGGLLQENYEFADILAPEYSVGNVPLAAFAQDPPSYRNACFGVVFANGGAGPSLITKYRSLGAPQVFEIRDDHLLRWKMTGQGDPQLLEQVTVAEVTPLFQKYREDWSPVRILRAKSSGGAVASQLDFFDLGLLPLLEHEARVKLDRLLHETVALSIQEFKRLSPFTDDHYPRLFRLLFRLIAAKVLADRGHPGDWLKDDPRLAVRAVQDFYFKGSAPEPVLEDYQTQVVAWERIKKAFHFQNLSVDSLAYVYENTLVAPETRKLFGIHSTPPAIAEYITRQLPFEDLEMDQRRVFEPFAGHAVFLVAAMQRMRELLPPEMTSEQRHRYFVEMLSGIEIDDFAREVAQLSLMLADYPNPDGWRLYRDDALDSQLFEQELNAAQVVLCNPPFEEFGPEEKNSYTDLFSTHKPAAILHRVLQKPPELLGFVLPRVFLMGRGYRQLRSQIGQTYSSIELIALPDKVFQHSDAETVLLLASKKNGKSVRIRAAEVYEKDLGNFYLTRRPSYESETTVDSSLASFESSMWVPPLQEVWKATAHLRKLGELAEIHRGIEYNLPFRQHEKDLVSEQQRAGFARGVHRVEDSVEPFLVIKTVYLNVSRELMRTSAHTLAWDKPKLIVNARRRTRGHWKITASPDYSGLVCYQNFHGIWPTNNISLEVLAAILNSPMANAFVAVREGQRDVRIQTLRGIPVPDLHPDQEEAISSLVQRYAESREQWISGAFAPKEAHDACARLLKLIDAEVLKAYDLSPRTERVLLDYFSEHSRPGPVTFKEYFPATFKPCIPWHRFLSEEIEEAAAAATLSRLPVIDDPIISEALEYLYHDSLG